MHVSDTAKRWLGLVAIALGVALIVVDTTIVNVIVPSIVRDLGVTSVQTQWIQESYVTLGLFLWNAARRPEANISLIWFTVCSSVVHAAVMAVQSFGSSHERMGHLWGDVPALLLVAVVLSVLVVSSGLKPPPVDRVAKQPA